MPAGLLSLVVTTPFAVTASLKPLTTVLSGLYTITQAGASVADNESESRSSRTPKGGGPHGTVVLSPDELPSRAEPGGEGADHVSDTPALVGVTAPFMDVRFRLQPERTRIGRDPQNDVVLNAPDVSLEHARIVRSSGEWRVVDLNSTNGIFINGTRVQQGALQYGDLIAFGPDAFLFAAGDMSPEAVRAMLSKSDRGRRWWFAGIGALLGAVAVLLLL